ncbi:MAG: Abi-like protein [Pelotomaculum sp. PtaB.Bin104]|nr:MAG: Abi-like protein [Pelotomaculum sp. PtaB.Bin104]
MGNEKVLKREPELKPPTTFEEQIEILKSRGLVVENEACAYGILHKVNYYRLSAYLLPFQVYGSDSFRDGTRFNQIYRIYEFDQKLRNLILYAIEPIEVLLRTQLAYYHSHKYGSEGYINPVNFESIRRHERFIEEFNGAVEKNKKALFVKHHIDKYGRRFPIWVAVELFSFGMLSKFYANMKINDQKDIAKKIFKTGPKQLRSWLICVTDLRNRCAHYMRIYFHKLVNYPRLPNGPYALCSQRIFDIIYVMKYLFLNHDKWKNSVVRELEALINEYSMDIQLRYIGFPENWLELLEERPVSPRRMPQGRHKMSR